MAISASSVIGVNLAAVSSDAAFGVGTVVNGTDGSQWVYALAAEAVIAYSFGVINSSDQFLNSTDARIKAAPGGILAVAGGGTAFTSSQYGWFQTKGVGRVRTAGATLPNVPLFTTDTETSATTGCLDNTTNSGSAVCIFGIMVTATGSTTGSAAACVINNLVARWPYP